MPNLNDIMEMMDALETKAIITIPTFCVAVRNRHSSCRKCVDACLADAITIEKNELNIDAGACVACGACVAVCPTSALVPMDPMPDDLAGAVAETTNAADGLTVIACARKAARNVGDPDKYAVVPCLARMEEELLVELVARGIPEICLVDGDCRTCKYRGAVPAIDDTVESTRTLIEAMGSDAQITRTSEFPASVQVEDMRKAVGAARREFFTSSGHYAKDVAKSAAEKVKTSCTVPFLPKVATAGPSSSSTRCSRAPSATSPSMSRNAPAAVCASCSVPPTLCARRSIAIRTRVRRTWSSRFPTASSAICAPTPV